MFFSHAILEAEFHRQDLLSDAADYRLARLARRPGTRHPEVPARLPTAATSSSGAHVHDEPDRDPRNADADCRYAVSR